MGSRPYILCATAFIPLKNKYRFRFLLLDTCFLFFCSLYSVLLDFLYLYGLFIFTSYYKVVVFIVPLQGLYAILLEMLWIV